MAERKGEEGGMTWGGVLGRQRKWWMKGHGDWGVRNGRLRNMSEKRLRERSCDGECNECVTRGRDTFMVERELYPR